MKIQVSKANVFISITYNFNYYVLYTICIKN